jgi:putative membrane protein
MRGSSIVAIIGAVLLFVLLLSLFGGGMMGWGMDGRGHMWGWDGGSWWGIGMMVVMVLLWALIIAGLIYGVSLLISRSSETGDRTRDDQQQPIDILRERYARGEITKEEFDQMRRDLE